MGTLMNSGSKDRACAHCGSNRLKRTGSKPNERFRKVGIKDALFLCGDCGKETAVMIIIPSK